MSLPTTIARPLGAAAPTRAAAGTDSLVKLYGEGANAVRALDGVTTEFAAAEFTAIMGPSGSGKSTLLHCLAGLDKPTSGRVLLGETDITTLSDKQLTLLRRDKIGFVFQAFNLLPTLTALENITLPLRLAGKRPDSDWLDTVVDAVGMRPRLSHRPHELSGGQQQRIAAARALVTQPKVVFADEPTGALDSRSSAELLGFLRNAVDTFGQTIIMVTHDPRAASYADRVIFLADGAVVDEMQSPTTERVLEAMKKLGG
jgi:putative ABC transport system ATP-binding protein